MITGKTNTKRVYFWISRKHSTVYLIEFFSENLNCMDLEEMSWHGFDHTSLAEPKESFSKGCCRRALRSPLGCLKARYSAPYYFWFILTISQMLPNSWKAFLLTIRLFKPQTTVCRNWKALWIELTTHTSKTTLGEKTRHKTWRVLLTTCISCYKQSCTLCLEMKSRQRRYQELDQQVQILTSTTMYQHDQGYSYNIDALWS